MSEPSTTSKIDPKKGTYLGTLCKRGHDHQGSGKSLRDKTKGGCIQCQNIYRRRDLQKHKIRRNASTRRWREQSQKDNIFAYVCSSVRSRSRPNQLVACDLDPKYLEDLWESQNGLCYWLGIRIHFDLPPYHPGKATLDKLIPKRGYIKGNVVWASNFANRGRVDTTAWEFQAFLKELRIANGAKPIIHSENTLTTPIVI